MHGHTCIMHTCRIYVSRCAHVMHVWLLPQVGPGQAGLPSLALALLLAPGSQHFGPALQPAGDSFWLDTACPVVPVSVGWQGLCMGPGQLQCAFGDLGDCSRWPAPWLHCTLAHLIADTCPG